MEIDDDLPWPALHQLPHLFALTLHNANEKAVKGIANSTLEFLRLVQPQAGAVEALFAPTTLRSIQIHGIQDQRRWTRTDLTSLCAFDLAHFSAFVIQVVGGTLPHCWSRMKNLRTFYCSNCMMSLPPTALRDLSSLNSFVAFRQWEMVPCALLHVENSGCKASWETRHATKDGKKGMAESTGHWDNFQEGPSFLCPAASYSFAFEEFLQLGWRNLRKLWLDGNFLTGVIPENIAVVWPHLESLDLYDNNLEGPIPASLGTLPFVKLQLQSNDFSGQVPKSVLRLAERPNILLGLQENPNLEGCAPLVGHWQNGIPGTRIGRCDEL
ncbi:unnamed protein product [Durusdinium trenchii]